MKLKGRLWPWQVHGAAFLLPALGLCVTYAAIGLYPFGPLSSLAFDMRSQYISFFSYLRNEVWLGGGDYLYTFSKALGGDMAGFAAYYLMSPINLILMLFSTETLPLAVSIITVCKVGLCGFTMSLFLNHKALRVESLLFSVPFALMDYNIAYQINLMWLDSVILLPLIVLGIERLLEGKSPACYVVALAAALAVNYYIGFMLCLFSLLWFAVSALCFHPQPPGGWGQAGALRPVWRFGVASLLGGGLAATVLLPAFFSLQGGKAGLATEGIWDPSWATLADVVSRYLPGTANVTQVFFGYPHIYCGMLALVCTALFFTSRGKKVGRRVKWGAAVLLGVLLLSFCVGPLDRLWHGMNKPVGFLYRYSFLFSFVLLCVAWQGFLTLRARQVRRSVPLIVALYGVAIWLATRESHTHITQGKLVYGMLLFFGTALLVWVYSQNRLKNGAYILLLITLVDMGANMYISLRNMEYLPMADYMNYVQTEQPVIKAIKAQDEDFYRIEKTYSFSDNDAMLFGYRGLSHFSSADKMFVRQFLDSLGFSDGGYSVKYVDGSTVAVDALLGVKYVVAGGNMDKPYDLLLQENGRQVWENPFVLPLGFMAGPGAANALPGNKNLFAGLNDAWRALDPTLDRNLYRMTTAETLLYGINVREYDGEQLYERYEDGGCVEYLLQADSADMMYALFTTKSYRDADLYVNDQYMGVLMTNDNHGIVALGCFEPGAMVSVKLAPRGWELFVEEALFAYEDGALLAESTARLATDGYVLEGFGSSWFSGTVQVTAESGRNTLVLSIPYDEGWQVWVDGVKTGTHAALGALTAVPLGEGSHQVQLRYVPPGLWAGLALTAVSLLGFLAWLLGQRRRAVTPAPVPDAPDAMGEGTP